jgi:hypothetical protein
MSLVNSFQGHFNEINKIKQCPFNTNYVATCSYDRTIKIWYVYSSFNWTLIQTYLNHSSGVVALEWLDEDTLASAGWSDQTIKIWSSNTSKTNGIINTFADVYSLKLFFNQIHLGAGLNSDINIYNINDGSLVSTLKGHSDRVNDLVQICDDLLASSSDDETVRIWNLTTNTCKFILTGHSDRVNGLKQITPSILASGCWDDTVKLWNITSGQLIRTLINHTSNIDWSVDLLNSQTLISGSWDQCIKLWNWSTGEDLSSIQTNSDIRSLAVISDNI